MGSVKYSKIKTSNGLINLNMNDNVEIHEFDCDNYEYLKVYAAAGRLKLYVNHSDDYISIDVNGLIEFELKDFQINHVKFELDDVPEGGVREGYLQYYLCK
ncbi:hypothetical protein [Clostridium kluyveri]|uniref:Uncharacterized protein n=2 Tax=Clostridium kluyveri TaxID=1534 RepID=A5N5F6_CLOK5|nr:hypothetical protein [Clostridium kluyveri]EDK32537.1 Hypothetical protein CKL_0483 [Clostridium kluyveri DSM 555]BAH05477.1 hypothetical protein CKR_0426 [Clostridium kluyveri NBRC 12016]